MECYELSYFYISNDESLSQLKRTGSHYILPVEAEEKGLKARSCSKGNLEERVSCDMRHGKQFGKKANRTVSNSNV